MEEPDEVINWKECWQDACATAARLRLPLGRKVWHGSDGEFTGSGSGSSLDFHDHRIYSPGDDIRHINWQAYARTGQYTMKLFRAEARPVVDVIIDASESMMYTAEKFRRSAGLFYFVIESCRSQGAAVRAQLIRGGKSRELTMEMIRGHHWITAAREIPEPSHLAVPELNQVPLRAGSLRILISDLLFPGDPTPFFRQLLQRDGNATVFCPFTMEEAAPDWDGNFEFIDVESGHHRPQRVEPAALERYRSAYRNHCALWQSAALQHHASLVRVSCEPPLTTVLAAAALTTGVLETC